MGLDSRRVSWNTLSCTEWPTFGVGWPPRGSFSRDLVSKVKAVITRPGRSGHLDQAPYILLWQDFLDDPPNWLRYFLLGSPNGGAVPTLALPASIVQNSQVNVQKEGKIAAQKKPVFQEDPGLYPSLIDLNFNVTQGERIHPSMQSHCLPRK